MTLKKNWKTRKNIKRGVLVLDKKVKIVVILEKIKNLRQINKSTKNNFTRNPFKYISVLWSKLALIQKIFFVSIIFVVIGSFVALKMLTQTHTLVPVINFPIKDERTLDRIVLRINQEDVKVNITANGIIQVTDEVTARRMRAMLITEDLIPSEIDTWKIFNKTRWTVTDFERNVNFRKAQVHMITDHIKAIEGIDDATVIVIYPERSLFLYNPDHQRQIAACVFIIPKSRSDITKNRKKIRGIQKILKLVIPGLADENIVITDRNGLMLNYFE